MRLEIPARIETRNRRPAPGPRPRKPGRGRRRGVSLVEALVCLGLIALSATVLVRILPSARQGMALSEHHLDAAFLGRTLLEQARSQGFEGVAPGQGRLTQAETRDRVESVQEFLYSLEVASPASDRKHVWITMRWREPGGQKSLVMETLLTRRHETGRVI